MYVIPLVFPKVRFLLDDVPTTGKVFHRSHVDSQQYLTLAHWLLFRRLSVVSNCLAEIDLMESEARAGEALLGRSKE